MPHCLLIPYILVLLFFPYSSALTCLSLASDMKCCVMYILYFLNVISVANFASNVKPKVNFKISNSASI